MGHFKMPRLQMGVFQMVVTIACGHWLSFQLSFVPWVQFWPQIFKIPFLGGFFLKSGKFLGFCYFWHILYHSYLSYSVSVWYARLIHYITQSILFWFHWEKSLEIQSVLLGALVFKSFFVQVAIIMYVIWISYP